MNGGAIGSQGTLDLSGGNNIFYGNWAGNHGGAIYHFANRQNIFSNCTFIANRCGVNYGGGAIHFQNVNTVLPTS